MAESGHNSTVDYYFGFDVEAYTLSDPTSVVYINLTVSTNSSFTYFSFSILIIAEPMDQYFWIVEVNTTIGNIFINYSSPYNLSNSMKMYPFVTSWTGKLSSYPYISLTIPNFATTKFTIRYEFNNFTMFSYSKGFVLFIGNILNNPKFNNI